ncbi:MAG TPA: Flp family type IVb pilin [Rhizomicrobium sp.]|jgi:pilus assembly protein Flp/PilA
MNKLISRFVRDESGATAIEYGLIAALIAVVIIAVLTAIGGDLNTKFKAVQTGLEQGGGAAPAAGGGT